MSPQKTIQITDADAVYKFQINLEKKRIELILKKPFFTQDDLVISENRVPDLVLITFYKKLQELVNEYQTSQLNRK